MVGGTAEVHVPPLLAFGIREWEKSMVSEHLPLLSVDMRTHREMNAPRQVKVEEMATVHEGVLVEGIEQANVMATLVDLRNANVAGIAFENRQRLVKVFSEPGKPNDTGRTEVQGACCSAFIFVFLASPSTCFSKGGGFPSTVCPA